MLGSNPSLISTKIRKNGDLLKTNQNNFKLINK